MAAPSKTDIDSLRQQICAWLADPGEVVSETDLEMLVRNRQDRLKGSWGAFKVWQAANEAYQGELPMALQSLLDAHEDIGKHTWPSLLCSKVAWSTQQYLADMFRPMVYPDGTERPYQR